MSQCALVTGASSGIGTEFAKQLAARGFSVMLSGRNRSRLEELQTTLQSDNRIEARVAACDLSKLGSARQLYDECLQSGWEIEVLINNAGLGMFGETVEQDAERIEGLLALNVIALTTLSSLFAADMKARGSGRILNVGSLAGNQPTPYFASYAASKRYVHDFSLALRRELKSSGVTVSCLVPGFVRTNFDKNALIDHPRYLKASQRGGLTPEAVASVGLDALFRNRAVAVAGSVNRIVATTGVLVPSRIKAGLIAAGVKWLTRG